jgi:hypothetical protein
MQIIDKKVPTYLLYILGSLLFISIPIFSSPDFNTPGHLFDIAPFQRNFLSYILLLAFFYVNYLYFLPQLYFTKKQWLYFICIAACYILINFLPAWLIPGNGGINPMQGGPMPPPMSPGNGPTPGIMPMLPSGPLVSFLLVFSLGFLLKANQRMMNIQSEKLKTEVAYLRAQINPHFLFNTLNSVYSLALQKSDSAPEAILKLSSMMRYVVTESSRETVSLEKEIDYIKNYISLQQLRMDGEAVFSFIISGNPIGKSISPLLLIPFIENAFKYGLNPEKESFIAINIDITAHELILNVENNKVNIQTPNYEKSEQGIENTAQRLEYLYPDKHKLLIFDNEHTFTVNLSITLL